MTRRQILLCIGALAVIAAVAWWSHKETRDADVYYVHQYVEESGDTTEVRIPAYPRGKTWFKCPECGTRFKDWDIEDNATVFSMPMPCPKCGTPSQADGPLGWIRTLMEKVFK